MSGRCHARWVGNLTTCRDGAGWSHELAFRTLDPQNLLTLLLILGGNAAVKGKFAAFSESYHPQPLPLHGVSLGLDEDEKSVLTVEIGAAVLSFSLPCASMAKIGRTNLGMTEERAAS